MSFDANSFGRNAGFGIFGALVCAASAARANAQDSADEIATHTAVTSWVEAIEERDAVILELQTAVDALKTERVRHMDDMMLLSAELATAHQIIAGMAGT